MWFTSMLRSINRGPGRNHRIGRNSSRKSPSFLPRLECLEDRTVLSTLTVLNNFDNGVGSLRDAIVHARDGDTIAFDDDLAGHTITLTSGALVIKNSVDIEGPGASLLAVSGNDTSRVFDISAGLTVSITGLTITHGWARGNGGGGILNVGSALTLADAVLSYNLSISSAGVAYGGAISTWNDATLTITGSTFVGNQALGKANGVFAGGGGIFIDLRSTATVSHSTFIANRAVGGDGGVVRGANTNIGTGAGGAIHNDGHFTLENSSFIGNQAIGGSGGHGGNGASSYFIGIGAGGAVFNHEFQTVVINGCTFSDNEAIGGSNATGGASGQGRIGNGQGGALSNLGVVTVTNSAFDHNHARGGKGNRIESGSAALGQGVGGAIISSRVATTITVSNSTFTNNQAVGGAGNMGALQAGRGVGGGIATLLGAMTQVAGSTFNANQAIGGAGAVGANGGNGFGGGIYNDGRSTLEVRGSTITNNQAIGAAAGDDGSAGAGVGGGLYLELGGSVCLDAFTVAHLFGNEASTSDDEVFGDFTIC
jgi:hypothetical protein